MSQLTKASRFNQLSASWPRPIVKAISVASDYFNLMKPGIIVLLLITMVCPMIVASGGNVNFSTIIWAIVGGGLMSGSASAFNCILDRDIDAIMERTKNRAIPAGRVSVRNAIIFALFIGFLGLWVINTKLNPVAAWISLAGHLFYVVIYTVWLKRSTVQNIVIGGAAGAMPPLVGWAAVTHGISLTAVLLFLVIFLWTPAHFWALALNKNNDYRRAGIPMLPVIAGEKATHTQMFWYSVSLVPVSLLLVLSDPRLGWFSFVAILLLGLLFAYKVFQLKFVCVSAEQRTKKAWDVFGFSLIYLALFFFSIVVDSTLV